VRDPKGRLVLAYKVGEWGYNAGILLDVASEEVGEAK
jgi:hypothetical protein